MPTTSPEPIRPGDTIDVRAGPHGSTRRGVVVAVRNDDPAAYEVLWADGTATRLYASPRLVTVVEAPESGTEGR